MYDDYGLSKNARIFFEKKLEEFETGEISKEQIEKQIKELEEEWEEYEDNVADAHDIRLRIDNIKKQYKLDRNYLVYANNLIKDMEYLLKHGKDKYQEDKRQEDWGEFTKLFVDESSWDILISLYERQIKNIEWGLGKDHDLVKRAKDVYAEIINKYEAEIKNINNKLGGFKMDKINARDKEDVVLEIEELKEEIEGVEDLIAEIETDIEVMEDINGPYGEQYDDILDEDGRVSVAGLSYYPSQILKEIDPTAYRTGYNDYIDGELSEKENELSDAKDELKDKENELKKLEEELKKY